MVIWMICVVNYVINENNFYKIKMIFDVYRCILEMVIWINEKMFILYFNVWFNDFYLN